MAVGRPAVDTDPRFPLPVAGGFLEFVLLVSRFAAFILRVESRGGAPQLLNNLRPQLGNRLLAHLCLLCGPVLDPRFWHNYRAQNGIESANQLAGVE